MWVTKLLISPVKKRIFCPKNDQIGPKIGVFGQFGPGHAGFFGALLVGRLVVVARGLYLARHLFPLNKLSKLGGSNLDKIQKNSNFFRETFPYCRCTIKKSGEENARLVNFPNFIEIDTEL